MTSDIFWHIFARWKLSNHTVCAESKAAFLPVFAFSWSCAGWKQVKNMHFGSFGESTTVQHCFFFFGYKTLCLNFWLIDFLENLPSPNSRHWPYWQSWSNLHSMSLRQLFIPKMSYCYKWKFIRQPEKI